MRLLVLVTGEYGWRHVANLRQYAPETWQIETWMTPGILPPIVDYPEDYLPDTLPDCDLILSLAEVKGVAELIPDMAKLTHARAVIAPIDNTVWLPVGLARQLTEWLARIQVACVTPKPFCSLTETHYNSLRLKLPYDDPLIREFARFFGRPTFAESTVEQGKITHLTVQRDACCGCARYVAEKLIGTPIDDALEAGGLYHHHYPCQASMGIDPQYGDTLMHISGNIMKDALHESLLPFLKQQYIRPSGYTDDADST